MRRLNTSRRPRVSLKNRAVSRSTKFSGPLALGLCASVPGAKNPIQAIVRHAESVVLLSRQTEPPYRPALYAELQHVSRITQKVMDIEGRLVPSNNGFTIELRSDRSHERKNFTCAHEVAHTFFYELVPSIKYRNLDSARIVQDNEEEYLCNIAASELLMPRSSIVRISGDYAPSPLSVLRIAQIYETSLVATIIRLLTLGIWEAKFVLWEFSGDNLTAKWLAQPGRALVHFPVLDVENYEVSSVRNTFTTGEPIASEEWLCFDRRFMFCKMNSMKLPNSNKVLSCIGGSMREGHAANESRSSETALPVDYRCECNGTGTRLIKKDGQTYGTICLASTHG